MGGHSVRSIARTLVLVLLMTVLWQYRHEIVERWEAKLHSWQARRSVTDAIRSTAYFVHESKWLEFDIPTQAVGLRLLTNAAVSNTTLPLISLERPRRGWKYALDFELLDDRLQVARQRRYHLRTRISDLQDAGREFGEGKTWFQESSLVPAQTRTIQIPLPDVNARSRRLRVRLGERDEQVKTVVARLYFKYQRPNFDQPYAWSRMSVQARQRLCRASVYPPELLSPWERQNLLRWDWTALPPLGQCDMDYQQCLIYQREDPQLGDFEYLPPPDGIICRPQIPVTIPTPVDEGSVQLRFFPDHEVTQIDRAMVDVQVHRKLLGVVARRQQRANDGSGVLQLDTSGDLLEIRTNQYLICVATWQPQNETSKHIADETIPLTSSGQTIRAVARRPGAAGFQHHPH